MKKLLLLGIVSLSSIYLTGGEWRVYIEGGKAKLLFVAYPADIIDLQSMASEDRDDIKKFYGSLNQKGDTIVEDSDDPTDMTATVLVAHGNLHKPESLDDQEEQELFGLAPPPVAAPVTHSSLSGAGSPKAGSGS